MHRLIKILTSRLIIVGILIAAQVWFLVSFFIHTAAVLKLTPVLTVLSWVLAIYVFNRQEDPEFKMVWCMLILGVPFVGIPMYILCAGKPMPRKLYDEVMRAFNRMTLILDQDESIMKELERDHPNVHKIFNYGLNNCRFPVYKNTIGTYFDSGEEFLEPFLKDLQKAEHFILMEFFIIDEGKMWDSILEILKQKAASGVEVILIYDDFGCSTTLPYNYDKKLRAFGIKAYRFNRLRPALIIQMNNRDHRKICVIDNRIGYTGGVNLADEYINERRRFGYWRDSAMKIEGAAVQSMTDLFLSMYGYLSGTEVRYEDYHLPSGIVAEEGLFQPFGDSPMDEDDVGLSMHLNLINHARRYIYINTPYLVLNADMIRALSLAAESGVDVRILVPHVPDKRYVFQITRSNYEELLWAGVKIYEFTPGFNHSKNIICDDNLAVAGTVNTDYRSYYFHFENGILIYRSPEILRMRYDFESALAQSDEVTMETLKKTNILVRLYRAVLRLLAPLF